MIGTTLGHYRIIESLGAGGMGEVFLANDQKLGRRVALKVLAKAFASDPDRLARFEREARSVAALNHPHIVTVYSIEEHQGISFLTMELVEGRTLAASVTPGGLSLEQLLALAIPLADAVSAAHDRGIIHRDLKPANVMIGGDGRLKVLDFGLSKLVEPVSAAPADVTVRMGELTSEGVVVGTAAYMSPEQAEGRHVDQRSDIFSLGIMLYELSTGERPFKGDTNLSIMSSILRDAPRLLSDVNPSAPRELVRVVRRCLNKNPDQRYQSAKDLRNELQDLKQELDSGMLHSGPAYGAPAPVSASAAAQPTVVSAAPAASAPAAVPSSVPAAISTPSTAPAATRTWMPLVVAGIILAAAVGGWLAWQRFGPRAEPPIEANFTQLTSRAGIESTPSVSPDGKWIVYVSAADGDEDIYLQGVGGQNPINLTGDSPGADAQPSFSPDGERIAFRSERQGGGIFVMGRTGEFAKRVVEGGFNPAWKPDGTEIVYSTASVVFNPYGRTSNGELWIVDVTSMEKRLLFKGDAVQPSWSPNGLHVAYWAVPRGGSSRDIFTIPATGTGAPVAITNDYAVDWNPIWARDGRWLFFSSDRRGSLNLWRVPMDPATGAATGPPAAVTSPSAYVANLSLSADGRRLVYTSVLITSTVQRLNFDPAAGAVRGDAAPVSTDSRFKSDLQVSPDGQSLVYRSGLAQEDIFTCLADGTGDRPLTSDATRDRFPVWSPDGKQIAFYSDRSGKYELWLMNADGTGMRQFSASPESRSYSYPRFSPDGSKLVFTDIRGTQTSIADPRKPWSDQSLDVLPQAPGGGRFLAWSWTSDGTRLAGAIGTAIATFNLADQTYHLVPGAAGAEPVWLGDNRRLLYRSGGVRLMMADTVSGRVAEVLSAAPEQLRWFAISPDNRHLFLARGSTDADIWMAELK